MGIPAKYYNEMINKKKTNKYGNNKIEYDGHTFDSLKEKRRYAELKLMERAGAIDELELQKEFELIPAQYDENGKCIERAVKYKADFYYYDFEKNEMIAEDVKGYKGGGAYAVFTIKRKLMLQKYGLQIKEV